MEGAVGHACLRGESVREFPKVFVAYVCDFEGGFQSGRRRENVAVVVAVVASVVGFRATVVVVVVAAVAVVTCSRGRASGSSADCFEGGQDIRPGWQGRRKGAGGRR